MIRSSKYYKYIAIVFLIGLVFFLFSIGECNKLKLDGDHRYTIGTVGNYNKVRFKYEYNYIFYINGKLYEGRSRGTKATPNEMKGQKFFVKYYRLDPTISDIILDRPISDNITIPIEGWTELPKQN